MSKLVAVIATYWLGAFLTKQKKNSNFLKSFENKLDIFNKSLLDPLDSVMEKLMLEKQKSQAPQVGFPQPFFLWSSSVNMMSTNASYIQFLWSGSNIFPNVTEIIRIYSVNRAIYVETQHMFKSTKSSKYFPNFFVSPFVRHALHFDSTPSKCINSLHRSVPYNENTPGEKNRIILALAGFVLCTFSFHFTEQQTVKHNIKHSSS